MPIYMDRHDVSEAVTAENVAQLHQEDLKVQHKFNCRGLTYWFDEKRKTAFCLVEAPSKQTVKEMHNHAHGVVPHMIIEVDATIVESFLGRIEDPENAQNTDLNIINDPAFRTIMVIRIKRTKLIDQLSNPPNSPFLNYNKPINIIIDQFSGRLVKQSEDYFLASFESVSKSVLCAIAVQTECENLANQINAKNIKLKIGLSAGVPVTEKDALFEDTIKFAERICNHINAKIAVSPEVKELYKSENLNAFIKGDQILALTTADEKFINQLMDYTEKSWRNAELKVEDFSAHLGNSKSQLYRKMILLTGKSPNAFLKEYRLNKALKLLNRHADNISEIAFDSGFSSPSYFSKCFQKMYGQTPSEYLQTKEA